MKPSFFEMKIARLILKGRFGRAHREIQRFNAGKRDKVKLLPTEPEQRAWAESVLAKAVA